MKHFSFLAVLFLAAACTSPQTDTLVILHTNDTHSQVEPLAANVKNGGLGGYARRMAFIEQIRSEESNVLLLDAGDFCQGTPYFNFYNGRIEVDAMNKMHYDAATLGNHEFDNGIDTLAAVLKSATFPVVCANYEVAGTPLENIVKPYVILKKKGLKIGVFGLGVKPDGLISAINFQPLMYHEPLPLANELAAQLRNTEKCDVVICLSHLGFNKPLPDFSDVWLAENSENIDVIIGGHTHLLVEQTKIANMNGDSVVVAQMGKSGIAVGKITLSLER